MTNFERNFPSNPWSNSFCDKLPARSQHVLNNLLSQIFELGKMHTSRVGEAKKLNAVRNVSVFKGVYPNAPEELEFTFNLTLLWLGSDLELNREEFRNLTMRAAGDGFYYGCWEEVPFGVEEKDQY